VGEPQGKSMWERVVELTIAYGERVLAPIERFIGKRSLVGDATFFPLERFPWVDRIEQNWTVIREEAERLLEHQADLANFQDISKDQIEITDDDRWKTFFLYGPYKGVLRYHLGLIVPQDAEACRIRVGEDIRHWQEGKSMIFDDTFNHEVWNDTDETRVVLFVDVLRPLPEPDSTINRAIVKAIGYSPFVLDAKRNQEAWEARYRQRRRASPVEQPAA